MLFQFIGGDLPYIAGDPGKIRALIIDAVVAVGDRNAIEIIRTHYGAYRTPAHALGNGSGHIFLEGVERQLVADRSGVQKKPALCRRRHVLVNAVSVRQHQDDILGAAALLFRRHGLRIRVSEHIRQKTDLLRAVHGELIGGAVPADAEIICRTVAVLIQDLQCFGNDRVEAVILFAAVSGVVDDGDAA